MEQISLTIVIERPPMVVMSDIGSAIWEKTASGRIRSNTKKKGIQ
jgi:hypothetical protein